MVDSDYCFSYVDVGAKGRGSDGYLDMVYFKIALCTTLSKQTPLNYWKTSLFLADDAFPLKKYLMKPYSRRKMSPEERIYNYRVSRARRVVENAFGILASKFRLFEKPMSLKLETLDKVVLACCTIHNWLKKNKSSLCNE